MRLFANQMFGIGGICFLIALSVFLNSQEPHTHLEYNKAAKHSSSKLPKKKREFT